MAELPYSKILDNMDDLLIVSGQWSLSGIIPPPPTNMLTNGDFENGVAGWNPYVTGGNVANLTTVGTDPYDGILAGLFDCTTHITPEPDGVVALQNHFDPTQIIGKQLTASFAYKSDVDFHSYVICQTNLGEQAVYLQPCAVADVWTPVQFTTTVIPLPVNSLAWDSVWLDLRLYGVGQLFVDGASVVAV